MKKIIVAPVGDHMDDLFVGIKEFPTEKVILLSPKNRLDFAKEAKESLDKFRISSSVVEIEGHLWEGIFQEVSRINKEEKGDIVVIVSTGDRDTRCAATSAAFVNGLKALAVENDTAMMLPILKFSYYSLITDKKMRILEFIYECRDCVSSLEDLSKKLKMSLPLLSYHVNGNLKSEGLKKLGLVDLEENKGRVKVKLSLLGNMLLKGYVQ